MSILLNVCNLTALLALRIEDIPSVEVCDDLAKSPAPIGGAIASTHSNDMRMGCRGGNGFLFGANDAVSHRSVISKVIDVETQLKPHVKKIFSFL
jgi:hypothetical protein